ncbi:MAG TPA: hypothetical protein VHD34_03575 [Xanthobacteraceae bacterium]|nr:hypothetical protein [Xanthobacteraceae bacterium]
MIGSGRTRLSFSSSEILPEPFGTDPQQLPLELARHLLESAPAHSAILQSPLAWMNLHGKRNNSDEHIRRMNLHGAARIRSAKKAARKGRNNS